MATNDELEQRVKTLEELLGRRDSADRIESSLNAMTGLLGAAAVNMSDQNRQLEQLRADMATVRTTLAKVLTLMADKIES